MCLLHLGITTTTKLEQQAADVPADLIIVLEANAHTTNTHIQTGG